MGLALAALLILLLLLFIYSLLAWRSRTRARTQRLQKCVLATSDGAYFETGNIIQ